jgi:hypothetical protein
VGITGIGESLGSFIFEFQKTQQKKPVLSSNNKLYDPGMNNKDPENGSKEETERGDNVTATLGLLMRKARKRTKYRLQLTRVTEMSENPTSKVITTVQE